MQDPTETPATLEEVITEAKNLSQVSKAERAQFSSVATPDNSTDMVVDNLPSAAETKSKMTADQILTVIRNLVAADQITPEQAKRMRQKFGITQGYFTAKRFSKAKKVKARKLAQAKRKINRSNGSTKGQKRNNGTFG